MAETSASSFVRFSTDRRGRDPARALRELNEREVVFRLDPLAGRPIHADILVHARPEARILSAALSGVSHGAGPEPRAGGADDELLLASTLSGRSILRQSGREITLADGDGVILRRSDGPFTLTHPDRVRFLGLRIPRRAIAPLVTRVDDAVMRRIPGGAGPLGLLAAYLDAVVNHRLLDAPDEQATVVRHVHDLVALILGATGASAMLARERGLRAARLRAIRSDVVASLEDPGLTIASIATGRGISSRYVHKLFERTGSTFSEFVLEQRLLRAYRMLVDPRADGDAVSAIAFAVGFGDLSYFNRTFRRRFGATPSDLRRRRKS